MQNRHFTVTPRERAAASRLAEALIEFDLAFEEGGGQRRAEREARIDKRLEGEVPPQAARTSWKVQPPPTLPPGLYDNR